MQHGTCERGGRGSAESAPRRETGAVALLFFLYLLFQVNAALHHGSWGQDFGIHKGWVADAVADPWKFFTYYENGRTNPPLYHLFCAFIYRMTGAVHWLETVALAGTAANAVSLLLLYGIMRRIMRSPVLRLACLGFLLFLPVAMIHATVLASDALATPIFLAVLYGLARIAHTQSTRAYIGWVVWVAALLIVGLGVKFTFGAVLLGVMLSIVVLWRACIVSRRLAIAGMAIIAAGPGLVAVAEFSVYRSQQTYNNGLNLTGSAMSVRSIVFFRSQDAHVLQAPPYNERAAAPVPARGDTPAHDFNLLIPDKYSYPALVHLGMFTDLMNIYQFDPHDSYFGRRSEINHARMALAVKTGVVFFVALLLLAPAYTLISLRRSLLLRKPDLAIVSVIGICSGLFLLNVAAGLPFVRAYYAGYWMPRLILPALLGYFVITFCAVERLAGVRIRQVAFGCAILVGAQSALHASFLWPWGRQLEPEPVTVKPGPLFDRLVAEFKVTFPEHPVGVLEPLVVTGRAGAGDFIYARYTPENHVAIVFNHWNSPVHAASAPIRVEPGRVYDLRVEMDRPASAVACWVDNVQVLKHKQELYPSQETEVTVGENRIGGGTVGGRFAGEVKERRLAFSSGVSQKFAVRVRAELPALESGGAEPLVITGVANAADVVFVRYLPEDRFQLVYNHWGRPEFPASAPLPRRRGRPRLFEVEFDRGKGLIVCRVDGAEALRHAEALYPTARTQVAVGEDRIGTGVTTREFSGRILSQETLF